MNNTFYRLVKAIIGWHLLIVIIVFFVFTIEEVIAESDIQDEDKEAGLLIAQKSFYRETEKNYIAIGQLVVYNTESLQKKRYQATFIRIHEDNSRNLLIRITLPRNLIGTMYVSPEWEGMNKVPFLYDPNKQKKSYITSLNHKYFSKSDFQHEFFERIATGKFRYQLLDNNVLVRDRKCFLIKETPKENTRSNFGYIKSWIEKKYFIPVVKMYYDHAGKHIKTYQVNEFEEHGNVLIEKIIIMEDLLKKRRTCIKLDKINSNSPDAKKIYWKYHPIT